MIGASIDPVIDAIRDGSLGRPLQRLVDAAAHVARTPAAILTVRQGDHDVVLAARGIPLAAYKQVLPALPGTQAILGRPYLIADTRHDPLFAKHPLTHDGTRWQWAVLMPVHIHGSPPAFVLTCGDYRRNVTRPGDLLARLQRVADCIADELELMAEIAALTEQLRQFGDSARLAEAAPPECAFPNALPVESPAVVSDFLLSTLVPQRRLLRRGAVPYHALFKWRTSLKSWQILALRALKRDLPDILIDRVAQELADAARALYGTGTFQAVAAVPCGHSGEDCLSSRLGSATAARLGVPSIAAFATLAVKGSSHPRRNTRRSAMRLREAPDMPVLLIDDVASSGAHIEEAARLLRETAPAVLPLVWIAN